MPAPPARLTSSALLDPVDDAAVALDDLAGDLRRIECAERAQLGIRISRRSELDAEGRGEWRRCRDRPGRRRAHVASAVPKLDGLERSAMGRRCDRGHPRRGMVERAGARAAVAGRVGDEHACVRGCPECLRDRVERVGLGAAADGVVEDVDTVEHGGVDRGHAVGVEAAVGDAGLTGPADLVRGDLGAGRHAGHGAVVEHLALDRDAGHPIACRRGGGMRSVAIAIARREELRLVDVVLSEARDEVAGADELVVARRDREPLPGDALAVPIGRHRDPRAAGEGLALGPDARVDDTDDHAGTSAPVAAELRPETGRAIKTKERRAEAGIRVRELDPSTG